MITGHQGAPGQIHCTAVILSEKVPLNRRARGPGVNPLQRSQSQGITGSAFALITLFFPSFLLVGGLLPFWSDLGRLAPMRRALLGINASVVGILLAALFQPVWQTGIRGGAEFSLALVAFVLLVSWRQPTWRVVLFCAGVGGLTLA